MMIQDIAPKSLDISFKKRKVHKNDRVIIAIDGIIVLKESRGLSAYKASELEDFGTNLSDYSSENMAYSGNEGLEYFCKIDNVYYYLLNLSEDNDVEKKLINSKKFSDQNKFRWLNPSYLGFACITAAHVARWRNNNKYCGKCGNIMKKSSEERAYTCDECGHTVYPTISPAMIVGIVDGDKLLITRAVGADPSRPALVSGYCEVGETIEATIKREVKEEVGLEVSDITYFASQPWSFSSSLLVGYFAKLKGSGKVSLNDGELEEAVWQSRQEIKPFEIGVALTSDMIKFFKSGGNPFENNCTKKL